MRYLEYYIIFLYDKLISILYSVLLDISKGKLTTYICVCLSEELRIRVKDMTYIRVRNKLIFRIDSTFLKQIQIAIILSTRSNRILFDKLYDIRRNAQHASLRESESGVLTLRDTRVPIYLYT